MQLHKVQIKRIIGPTPHGAAVLLGNEIKTFVIFVGFYEAAALIREINGETPARPLTHELIQNVYLGFDIEVKQVIVSAIIDNTFCATLILEQRLSEDADGGDWSGRRNEVRIDARPSDCLVLALKNKIDIEVTAEVFDQVQDVSKMAQEVENSLAGDMPPAEFGEYRPPDDFTQTRSASSEDEEDSFLGADGDIIGEDSLGGASPDESSASDDATGGDPADGDSASDDSTGGDPADGNPSEDDDEEF